MKFHLVLTLTMACSSLLSAQSGFLKFREDGWREIGACKSCASCNGQAADGMQIQKTFAFYCGETLIGTWQLSKIISTGCDVALYQTSLEGKTDKKPDQFDTDLAAIEDICREVRYFCPNAQEIMRIESPYTDYSLNFIRDIFSYSPYTRKDMKLDTPDASTSDEEIFTKVDEAPKFPGCEGEDGNPLKNCSDQTSLKTLYGVMEYPREAREKGISGTVVVAFVVEKDGRVSNAQIQRAVGGGCDEAALRVVNAMNELGIAWIPGRIGAKPVRTQFSMPFQFSLE